MSIKNGSIKLAESLLPIFSVDERKLIKLIQDNNGVRISTLNADLLYAAKQLIHRKSVYEYKGMFSSDKYYGICTATPNNTDY